MAEVLTEFPGRERSRYDKFLDGQIWRLGPADAGDGSVKSLKTTLYGLARRRGRSLRVHVVDSDTIIVQAEVQ
jgi:hypothetical protein